MFYGEHLNADESAVTCKCGEIASVEVIDKSGCLHGWFCRRHAESKRNEIRRLEKLAKAIVRGRP
jgi:hypothetical protein